MVYAGGLSALKTICLKRFDRLPNNLKGAVVLMFAAFGFAAMVTLIKYVGDRLPISQILLMRQVVMVLMLAPVLFRNFPSALKSTRPALQLTRVAFALVAMTCGFTAVVHMPLADATALGFAKSFFVTIFAVLLLNETVGIHRWSAVAVGFIGVIVMLQPGTDGFTIYGLYAVIGAAAAGAVMVIIRLLSRTEASNTILAYQAIGVGLVMTVPAIVQWVPPTPLEWALLVGIGVISFFAQKANIYAFTYGEASMLASLDYVRLIYVTFFGWILFQHLPGAATIAGAAVIVLASIYTVQREARRRQVLASGPDGRGFNNS